MIPAALLGLAALLAPQPAAAQDAEAALALVRSCLAVAESRADAAACRGAYARDCAATTAGGETTLGIVACTTAETEAWDRLLNESYAELVLLARRRALLDEEAGLTPAPLEDMLREAQRAWIAFRDADCDQEHAIWGQGSQRQVAGAVCLMDRTATRVLELQAKRGQMALD
jgi:uncharacterized protein YecT (DUF1311 family)